MSKAKVTRIRIEVSGKERNDVQDVLMDAARFAREREGGAWEMEDDSLEIQTTKDGYWGRVTLRRKRASGDPIFAR